MPYPKEIKEKIDRVQKLCEKMDVPIFRRRNIGWLQRNLAIRNVGSYYFPEAKKLIDELIEKGIR